VKRLLFDGNGRLRNGWWALVFVAVTAVAGLLQAGLGKALTLAGLPKGQWRLALAVLAILTATWVCTRLRRESLASVGLRLDRRWSLELAFGTALGATQIALAALMLGQFGGVRLQLDPARSLAALAAGFLAFLAVALIEELLFRGFLFQRLRDGLGAWPALLILAVLFALAHWSNPGMEGAVKIWATLDTVLGALVLGLAYLRTNSLALPVGIHLGWNWMQGTVLGFGVSGTSRDQGWFKPVFVDDPTWFTGGAFGLEASAFAVIVDVGLLVVLLAWRRRMSAGVVDPDPHPEPAHYIARLDTM
jgi:uncharacterized protein